MALLSVQEQGNISNLLMIYSHTVVESNGNIYLFGGADSETRTNDLYEFSLSKFKHP